MPQIIYSVRGAHTQAHTHTHIHAHTHKQTHTHTHTSTFQIKGFQENRHTPAKQDKLKKIQILVLCDTSHKHEYAINTDLYFGNNFITVYYTVLGS